MIFVLEIPKQAEPRCWFAYDGGDLLRKVAAEDPLQEWEIHDCASPRELLDMFDATPGMPGVNEKFPGICAMGEEYGWDTPLYRADHLQEPGQARRQGAHIANLEAREGLTRLRPRPKPCLGGPEDSQSRRQKATAEPHQI